MNNEDIEEELLPLRDQIKEANELIKTHLPPLFDPECEGCRESMRMVKYYLDKYEKR